MNNPSKDAQEERAPMPLDQLARPMLSMQTNPKLKSAGKPAEEKDANTRPA